MSIALPIIDDFYKTLLKVPKEDIERLRNSLLDDCTLISSKFHNYVGGQYKYCMYGLLAGINTHKYESFDDLGKSRIAWKYALKYRGDEISPIEEFLNDREYLVKNKTRKEILVNTEVNQIIMVCQRIVGKRT